jgi:hypothetical protein
MGRMQRSKGSRFENIVAKKLIETTDYKWKRVPLSGGWAKEKCSGDIVCTEADFNFSIECKNQECWTFDSLPELGPIEGWWEQAVNDSVALKKVPVLVFTKNRRGIYVMYDSRTLINYIDVDFKWKFHVAINHAKWGMLEIVTWDDFTEAISWELALNGK